VFTNLGHQHPKVVAAIVEQAQRLTTVAPAHANATRAQAARLIIARAPDGFDKVFFTIYRSEFWARTPEEESARALHHLERVIQAEGPATIAAILLETIPGAAGVLVPPAGYLAGVRAIADRYGIVLILDEVMAGFARTGQWFAFDAFDVRPDLITFAKGVNSGYVPVGGVIISDAIAHAFDDRVFPSGLTYSGHPLAAASIVASLTAMAEEGVVANVARIGADVLGPGLAELAASHELVGEVRGTGVFGRSSWSATAGPENRSPRPRCPSSSELCWSGVCCRSSSTTGSTWCRLR